MSDDIRRQDRDLVLPPQSYAYVLDETKGRVTAYVGPYRTSLSNTDKLAVWDGERYQTTSSVEKAVQTFVTAAEGQYVVLANPATAKPEEFPSAGTTSEAVDLDAGKLIVIPGPTSFPLWPGQSAEVIDGHHLRHNQYLVVRVYDPEAARENAERAVVAPQRGDGGEDGESRGAETQPTAFTMGQLRVIRGTDVSFYVPPTGIEVVPDGRNFVREAATLERLEYAVLRDENGRKRYERGPAVIFPEPTETFVPNEDGGIRFRAIELNPQSGLYIKVVADYADEDGTRHPAGEELFLTGLQTPIYFPREEHSIIQYGDQRKHHAVAVPKGEGRYVLDRTDGEVGLVTGPSMFLPDPRTQVIVRRVLSDDTVEVMYPGNGEARAINAAYRRRRETADTDYLEAPVAEVASLLAAATPATSFGGEKMRRGTEYTPPRTVVLDNKYDGAVSINVWPGYAVLVMDKAGNRRVEVGPAPLLLAYDESLMVLSLSTGRPKTSDSPLREVYLRTINNRVTDQLTVETRDLVPVRLTLAFRASFEGEGDERLRWFDVEDYVGLLCDHARSRLRNTAKSHDVQEFYTNTIQIIRDSLLGSPAKEGERRTGLRFAENNLHVYDVEVLDVTIEEPGVQKLLEQATSHSLEGAIRVSQAEEDTRRLALMEGYKRERIAQEELTVAAQAEAALAEVRRRSAEEFEQAQTAQRVAEATAALDALVLTAERTRADQERDLIAKANEVDLVRLRGEVEQFATRMGAVDGKLVAALQSFGDQAFVERVVTAVGPAALAGGVATVDILRQVFEGTPFEGITNTLSERPLAARNGATTTKEKAS